MKRDGSGPQSSKSYIYIHMYLALCHPSLSPYESITSHDHDDIKPELKPRRQASLISPENTSSQSDRTIST